MSTIGNFTPQDGIVHGTAKFVRVMDPKVWKGDARLYKLDPPLFGDVEHAIVAALEDAPAPDPTLVLLGALIGAPTLPEGGTETMLVPTDEEGDDFSDEANALNSKHARELLGLVNTETADHVEFLAGVGYEVQA